MSKWIQLRASASRSPLRAPILWARHLGLDISDVFLASYPRSGNTLLGFTLAELLSRVPCTFENVQRIVPEIGVHGEAFPLLPGGGRLIKTHERYRTQYRRAIYIVRDVRDVLLSSFGRQSAMGLLNGSNLDHYIEPFLQGRMSRWGAWQDHVEQWLHSPLAQNGNLLVLHFEQILGNVEDALARILQFLSIPANSAAIHQAAFNNTIEKMRDKEFVSATLPRTESAAGRLVNSGTVNGWRNRLSCDQLSLVEKYAGKTLARLGYTTQAAESVAS